MHGSSIPSIATFLFLLLATTTNATLLPSLKGLFTKHGPQVNASDVRFTQYQRPGPDDSRSPCPALNAIANHGFIKRSGKNVNLPEIILGLFFGLGVSPEVSGVIGALGMASSSKPLTLGFDLHDLSKHMFAIEHDCSFSRQDALIGDNNAFNQELWEVALAKINGSKHVNPIEIGRAKSARIQDALRRNPQSVYGPRAAAFGYLEHGLLLTALGSPIPGISRLDYLRCFFEDERLPYHLGWRPLPEATNVATALAVGIASIAGDSHILTDAGRVIIGTPSDLLQTLVPPEYDFLADLTSMITDLGFDSKVMAPLKLLLGKV
ncbi:hypothetical protein MBLNU13_g09174t1 [Cladosporium sp. NU13]